MDSSDGEVASEVSEVFFDPMEQAKETVKIKIFSGSDERDIQKTINAWLRTVGPVVVHHVLQSESASDSTGWSLTISVFYVEPNRES